MLQNINESTARIPSITPGLNFDFIVSSDFHPLNPTTKNGMCGGAVGPKAIPLPNCRLMTESLFAVASTSLH
ncbi:hypothetical protein [Burkholderia catarinensis]|uniref:hypothetical protein n=1 Tax=Burkholderia catarinensis TaxID=1108140 RepID=UPI0010084BD7|nr:hypothetical protein [Burkholderia catarinensis]